MTKARTFFLSIALVCGLAASASREAVARYVYTVNGRQVSAAEYKAASLYNEARELVDKGRYDSARQKLEAALKKDPRDGDAHKALGYVFGQLDQMEEAGKEYRKALQLGAEGPELYLNLATIGQRSGNLKEAVAYFDQYLARYPGHEVYSVVASLNRDLKEELARWQRASQLPGAGSTRDYFAYATVEEGTLHWPSHKGTVKVYVEPAMAVRGYRASFADLLSKSFQRWSAASADKVRFEFVGDRGEADIVCAWVDNPAVLKSPAEGGEARLKYGLQGIHHVDILILTTDNLTGKPVSDSEIEAACLHEIGHAIGLCDHSPNPDDIMYCSLKTRGAAITARDIETLRMIYGSEIAYVPPRGSDREQQVQTALRHNQMVEVFNASVDAYNRRDYDKAIELAQEALRLEADCEEAKEIIETACNNRAADLYSTHNYLAAEQYLKKALALSFKTRSRSHRSTTLSNYALVLRSLDREAEAAQYDLQAESEKKVEGGIASLP